MTTEPTGEDPPPDYCNHGRPAVICCQCTHCMPIGPDGGYAFGHECSPKCWCEPNMTYKDAVTGDEVWLHNKAGAH